MCPLCSFPVALSTEMALTELGDGTFSVRSFAKEKACEKSLPGGREPARVRMRTRGQRRSGGSFFLPLSSLCLNSHK